MDDKKAFNILVIISLLLGLLWGYGLGKRSGYELGFDDGGVEAEDNFIEDFGQ